ncbi:sugar phosphate isomerase/epimerase [Paenibacillus sp. IB182496]|uniref:Sugar phosphate isomerase/epimerase n=1 Tax=Paenibacillus sabuli TaxID=2772509 RepID=A0A927BVW2_9BACL|nr:sugar phosphate isomerase/epimerase [Paenibacillus sabuli]MBD2847811.1 sugar phosphate isomerase/epimerase [Paenibacillus sabuli]
MRNKIAIQLHTLRDACKEDFPGVLRELGRMGWAGVQLAGYHGYDPEELAAVIRETGMKTAGLHVQLPLILEHGERLIQEAQLFGTRDLICSNTPQAMRNADGYRTLRSELNAYARRCASDNIRISYHNHAFEFETTIDEQPALRYLLDPAPDNAVLAEIDVYWVLKAGRDPLAFIAPYTGRMPLIHLKDMTDDAEQTFAEIGTGRIDFPPILQWGERSGVEWYVVEQDRCRRDPMESVRISYTQLSRMAEAFA